MRLVCGPGQVLFQMIFWFPLSDRPVTASAVALLWERRGSGEHCLLSRQDVLRFEHSLQS